MVDNNIKKRKGLKIGDTIENFSGIDQNGDKQELSELLKKGKVVVVFYRGQWCPVCIPHIRKLQEGLMDIYVNAANLLLITPEKQENIQKTFLKTNITIPILYDEGYKIMKLFDVEFTPTKIERLTYNVLLRADLKNAHSDDSQTLPIPATYIIDTDSTIKWKHFDYNYKNRASIKEIVENL